MQESESVTKDPIYGMPMHEASALHAKRDGKTFLSCCEHWRQKFLSADAGAKSENNSG